MSEPKSRTIRVERQTEEGNGNSQQQFAVIVNRLVLISQQLDYLISIAKPQVQTRDNEQKGKNTSKEFNDALEPSCAIWEETEKAKQQEGSTKKKPPYKMLLFAAFVLIAIIILISMLLQGEGYVWVWEA